MDLSLNQETGGLTHKGIRLELPYRFSDLLRGTQFTTSERNCNATIKAELSICIQPDSEMKKTIQIEYFKPEEAKKENILTESINSGLYTPALISSTEYLTSVSRVKIPFENSGALHAKIRNKGNQKRYYLIAALNKHHIWIFQSVSMSQKHSNQSVLEDFAKNVKIAVRE